MSGSSILNLNQGDMTLSSRIPFGDVSNGCDRSGSAADLLALLTPGGSDGFMTEYFAPSASGYVVGLTAPSDAATPGIWALVTPQAGYASMSINLPAGVDGFEVLVSCTQAVTTLTTIGATVGAAAQQVFGAPGALVANGYFRLRFDGVTRSWYRIG